MIFKIKVFFTNNKDEKIVKSYKLYAESKNEAIEKLKRGVNLKQFEKDGFVLTKIRSFNYFKEIERQKRKRQRKREKIRNLKKDVN